MRSTHPGNRCCAESTVQGMSNTAPEPSRTADRGDIGGPIGRPEISRAGRGRQSARESAHLRKLGEQFGAPVATVELAIGYDLPHAEGSPNGTFGLQPPAPAESAPLTSDIGVPSDVNEAAVSCRSVPNRSRIGLSYMTSPAGLLPSLAIGTPSSSTRRTTTKLTSPHRFRQPDRPSLAAFLARSASTRLRRLRRSGWIANVEIC